MNRKLLFVFFALISFGVSQAQHIHDHYCSRVPESLVNNNIKSKIVTPSAFTENYDLKYYRYEWFIDPAERYISGTVTTYFEALGKDQTSIGFDFTTELIIDSIVWKGQRIDFNQIGKYQLDVLFPEVLAENTLDSISITYHGEPPTSGFGSFIQDRHNNVPILWTLSEPFGAQDWWPCKNGNEDKIDSIDIIITTPEQYRAASNGVLISEFSPASSFKTYHWRHRHAIAPYLVAIAITNYDVYIDDVEFFDGTTMPMLNYVYPESLEDAKRGTASHVKVLQYFDSLFVSYPFKDEKYGHAQFSWGGGMEHQTMSFVINFGWGLLAHELAHQWFGDYLTCANWQEIWLNEGFATYLEGLSRERFPQSQNDWYNWKRNIIRNVTSQPGGAVKVADPTSVNSIFNSRLSYNKASFLVHMLRWKLGDEVFYQGLRNYLNDHKYSSVVTTDLKANLEAVSGQDLTSYFKNWFEGQGYPTYNISWAYQNDLLLIKAEQTTSHASVEFYDMPLPITIIGAGQSQNIRVEHTSNGQLFEIPVDFEVENIEFDPDLWLLALSTVTYDDALITSTHDIGRTTLLKPNPVQEALIISTDNGKWSSWNIISTDGKVLKSGYYSGNETTIHVADMLLGQYLIQLNNNNRESKILKWVKL